MLPIKVTGTAQLQSHSPPLDDQCLKVATGDVANLPSPEHTSRSPPHSGKQESCQNPPGFQRHLTARTVPDRRKSLPRLVLAHILPSNYCALTIVALTFERSRSRSRSRTAQRARWRDTTTTVQIVRAGSNGGATKADSKKPSFEGWAKCLNILVASRGIEPRTRGFSIRCSTN